jgi:ferri-bacillibactin esterase
MTACSARASAVRAMPISAIPRGPAAIEDTERFHLTAEGYDQPFQIDVALPALPVAPGTRLPVIYVVDGNWIFAQTAQTARQLAIGTDAIPQAIVVGIGYAIEGPMTFPRVAALRYRDLAPGVDEKHIGEMRRVLPPNVWPSEGDLGRAGQFLEFIEEGLKPFIEERYPADPGDQTILGVSLGGLFALHTLFAAPGSFQRYVAVSPSIWWNACALHDVEEQAGYLGGVGGRVFMGVGADEEDEAPDARMVMNMVELAERLRRSFQDVYLSSHVFDGEGHMSVGPAGICRGLRSVFARNPTSRYASGRGWPA